MEFVIINGMDYIQSGPSAGTASGLDDRLIILNDDTPVFRFIDAASFDSSTIHKIKIARQIKFPRNTLLRYKPFWEIRLKPASLTDLLLYLEKKDVKDYRLVLDTDDRELLSETIQQFLNLNIDMEVMLRREEREVRRMYLFTQMGSELQAILNRTRGQISRCAGNASDEDYIKMMFDVLDEMDAALNEMQGREIKVAVMALKKSGKSAVVNCLLGEEYAPASLEVPTFTTCIYRMSKSGRISLSYGGSEALFETPAEIRKHLTDEFKKMHSGEKEVCPGYDMEIQYVPGSVNRCNYTVIDTTGPDLAGTDHRKIAYKWISEADVILFIIDYSKYLTSAEEEFLGEIKRVFEEHGKFYSLIVVVNKLDMMYMSDEKKSAIRFTDFLKTKLHGLGYKGFVVFGVSALQYLYSIQAPRISGCESLRSKDGKKFRENLNHCLLLYQGKSEMTILSFLDTQMRNLRWFHQKKNATLLDLQDTSGFRQLMKYINHVSMEKAQFEFFNHRVHIVEQKLYDATNNYLLPLTDQCRMEDDELEKRKKVLVQLDTEASLAADEAAVFVSADNRILRDLNLAAKSLMMAVNTHIESLVQRFDKALKKISGSDLKAFIKTGWISFKDEFTEPVDKKTVEKLYLPVLGKFKDETNRKISEKEKRFSECRSSIQQRIEEHCSFLHADYCSSAHEAFLFLTPSFCRFEFPAIDLTLDESNIQPLIMEGLSRKRGLEGWLRLIISFGRTDIRTGKLIFNDVELKKALNIAKKELEKSAQNQINILHERLLEHIRDQSSVMGKKMIDASAPFVSEVEALCRQLTNDIDNLREGVRKRTLILGEMLKGLEQFSALWDSIKKKETAE